MRTHSNIENLSHRDQRWLNLGFSLGSALKRVLHRIDFAQGAPFPAELRQRT